MLTCPISYNIAYYAEYISHDQLNITFYRVNPRKYPKLFNKLTKRPTIKPYSISFIPGPTREVTTDTIPDMLIENAEAIINADEKLTGMEYLQVILLREEWILVNSVDDALEYMDLLEYVKSSEYFNVIDTELTPHNNSDYIKLHSLSVIYTKRKEERFIYLYLVKTDRIGNYFEKKEMLYMPFELLAQYNGLVYIGRLDTLINNPTLIPTSLLDTDSVLVEPERQFTKLGIEVGDKVVIETKLSLILDRLHRAYTVIKDIRSIARFTPDDYLIAMYNSVLDTINNSFEDAGIFHEIELLDD